MRAAYVTEVLVVSVDVRFSFFVSVSPTHFFISRLRLLRLYTHTMLSEAHVKAYIEREVSRRVLLAKEQLELSSYLQVP